MKKIKLNTNLFLIFSGTYETIWDWRHVLDYELSEGYLNSDTVLIDHDQWMESILEAYQCNTDKIIERFKDIGIKDINFTGWYSPKYYNFKTDLLDFTIKVDDDFDKRAIEKIKTDSNFREWLHENFRSRDGFISFTPSTEDEFIEAVETNREGYEQAIGVYLTYLLGSKGGIELEMLEYWNGNNMFSDAVTGYQLNS